MNRKGSLAIKEALIVELLRYYNDKAIFLFLEARGLS